MLAATNRVAEKNFGERMPMGEELLVDGEESYMAPGVHISELSFRAGQFGVFSRSSISAGSVVMVCRSALDVPYEKGNVMEDQLLRVLVENKGGSLDILNELYPRSKEDAEKTKLEPLSDSEFEELSRICDKPREEMNLIRKKFKLNAMSITANMDIPELNNPTYHSILHKGHYFNHCCMPNVTRVHTTNLVTIFRAVEDIEADKELTINYFPVEEVADGLPDEDFVCECGSCVPRNEDRNLELEHSIIDTLDALPPNMVTLHNLHQLIEQWITGFKLYIFGNVNHVLQGCACVLGFPVSRRARIKLAESLGLASYKQNHLEGLVLAELMIVCLTYQPVLPILHDLLEGPDFDFLSECLPPHLAIESERFADNVVDETTIPCLLRAACCLLIIGDKRAFLRDIIWLFQEAIK